MPKRTRILILISVGLSVVAIGAPFLRNSSNKSALSADPEKFVMELPAMLETRPPGEQLKMLLEYAESPSFGIRRATIETLGEYRGDGVVDALERAFLDSGSIIRQRVLEEMYDIDAKRGVGILLAGLRDEDLWIRDAAAMRIASLARGHRPGFDRTIVPDLIRALDDSSDAVVVFALTSLKHVTGNAWTVSSRASLSKRTEVINRWKAWWVKHGAGNNVAKGEPVQPTRMDPSPPFEFNDIDRKSVSLESQRGRITLLNFWGTWCPPCRIELPELIRVDRELHARGVDVIGVALSERNGVAGLRKWCSENGISYRQALASDSVLEAFDHIHEVPVSILIDREGRVRRRWDGERDFATFRAAIDACDAGNHLK